MGKRLIRLLLLCMFSCMFAVSAQAEEGGQKGEASIEQIYVDMPQVTVYGEGLKEAGDQPEAYLGTVKLKETSCTPFSQTGQGIDYYILLDVSNSMPPSYFTKLTSGITKFCGELSGEDRVSILTFGETVDVRADRTRDKEVLAQALKGVKNKDKKTLLFEAVSQAAQLSAQEDGSGLKRKVIVVISDGEDVAVGQKMAQEALDELKEKAVPAYALCIKDTKRSNINSFGEFARMSGGDIQVFDASQAEGVLGTLKERLMSADVMELVAPSNRVTNKYETFSLHIPGRQVPLNRDVLSFRWMPDKEPPQLLEAAQLEGRQIRVRFSEPVTGSGEAANYVLKSGEKVVPIGGVAVSEGEDNTVVITAAEAFGAGTYTLGCVNITDDSQEKNPVANTLSLSLADSDPAQAAAPSRSNRLTQIIAGAAILIVVAAVVFGIIFYRKIKKNRGVVFVEGKAVMASNVDVKQHVAIEPVESKKFELLAAVSGKNPKKLELSIERSMIVGRSNICDLYFDDSKMSRQHFALEWDGESMYIVDLNTTNGTFVNGERVTERRKLKKGDKIKAGTLELTINW